VALTRATGNRRGRRRRRRSVEELSSTLWYSELPIDRLLWLPFG
jgi:hypothetical protein